MRSPWEAVLGGKRNKTEPSALYEHISESTRSLHPQVKEIKQRRQETGVTVQGPVGQTEGKEGNAQAVEAGTRGLGRIQGCHQDVQRWDQKSQGMAGTALGKGCEN